MAQGDRTNNDAADAGAEGRERSEGQSAVTSGAEVVGNDPAGVGEGGVGATQGGGHVRGEGRASAAGAGEGGQAGEGSRPGDWNPGEQSGGGELY